MKSAADHTRKALVWPMRVVLAVVAVGVSFAVIIPAIGGIPGMLVAALLCAAALATDIVLSARLVGEPLEQVASRRVLMVDRALSPRDAAPLGSHHQLEEGETVDAEIVLEPTTEDEERPRLLPPR